MEGASSGARWAAAAPASPAPTPRARYSALRIFARGTRRMKGMSSSEVPESHGWELRAIMLRSTQGGPVTCWASCCGSSASSARAAAAPSRRGSSVLECVTKLFNYVIGAARQRARGVCLRAPCSRPVRHARIFARSSGHVDVAGERMKCVALILVALFDARRRRCSTGEPDFHWTRGAWSRVKYGARQAMLDGAALAHALVGRRGERPWPDHGRAAARRLHVPPGALRRAPPRDPRRRAAAALRRAGGDVVREQPLIARTHTV